MPCSQCGGVLELNPYTYTATFGAVEFHRTGLQPTCVDCKNVVITLDEGQKYELRTAKMALDAMRPVTGEVIRFTRKAMGLTKQEFATLLGIDSESEEITTRWENDNEQMDDYMVSLLKKALTSLYFAL